MQTSIKASANFLTNHTVTDAWFVRRGQVQGPFTLQNKQRQRVTRREAEEEEEQE